jgi:hypothetical protein
VTPARFARALEAVETLRESCHEVGIVLVGGAPYRAGEIEQAAGWPLFGVLPDDALGAALVAGAWTVGGRAARTPLAKAGRELAGRVVEALFGRVTGGEQAAVGGRR